MIGLWLSQLDSSLALEIKTSDNTPEQPSRDIVPRYVRNIYLYIFIPNPWFFPFSSLVEVLGLKMVLPRENLGKDRGLCLGFSTLVEPFESDIGLSFFVVVFHA